MLKKSRAAFAARLWAVRHDAALPAGSDPAQVGFAADPNMPAAAYHAMGFIAIGPRMLRADMAERLAAGLAKRGRAGAFALDAALFATAGCSRKQFPELAAALGFELAGIGEDGEARFQRAERKTNGKRKQKNKAQAKPPRTDPDSPFAALGEHALYGAGRRGRGGGKPRTAKGGA